MVKARSSNPALETNKSERKRERDREKGREKGRRLGKIESELVNVVSMWLKNYKKIISYGLINVILRRTYPYLC